MKEATLSSNEGAGRKRPAGRVLLVTLLTILVAVACGSSAQQAANDDSNTALMKKCRRLLVKGKPKKAIKLLEKANRASGERSADILVALSKVFNLVADHEQAGSYARKALAVSKDGPLGTAAYAELAFALAAENTDGPELRESIEKLRTYLDLEHSGPQSGRIRVRLCSARGLLPPEHALSLSAAESRGTQPDEIPVELDMVVKPRKIHAPTPGPLAKERNSLSKFETAVFQSIIDLDGCVSELKIQETSSLVYSRIAQRSVRQWVFEPARVGDEKKPVYYTLTTNYRQQ